MITNNVSFLHLVILSMAQQKYKEEIEETKMEEYVIGTNLDWESKEEWISDYIIEHFNMAKISIINKDGIKTEKEILNYENTIAMRMYSLDVGESFDFDNFNRIIRFPGGWGFKSTLKDHSVFIPYIDEFRNDGGILRKEYEKVMEVTNA